MTTTFKPRPYQRQAKRDAYKALEKHRSALVVMPTGTGKGALIGQVMADAVKAGKRVLAFVHREEIVDQLAAHAKTWAGVEAAVEQAERAQATPDHQIVVGSVPSLHNRRSLFDPTEFNLLIADECHHALARTWRELLDHFTGAKILGFTATPNRGDELALGQVFDEVAFDMSTPDAIMDGWLVPIRTITIPLQNLDLSGVRRRHGELLAGQLADAMIGVSREAVGPALDHAADKKAIVFCVTVPHMHVTANCIRLMALERRLDLPIATIDGNTPDKERRSIVDRFRRGEIRWLINVAVATEGFDVPDVEAVIRLNPTLSRARYIQEIGRGARPLAGLVDGLTAADMTVRVDDLLARGVMQDPEGWLARAVLEVQAGSDAAARRLAIALSSKPECLVLDFTDNSGKYDLANDLDLLGGDYELPDRDEARRLLAAGRANNLLDALERARAARLARMREAQARRGDPFALFDLSDRRDRFGRTATPKQQRAITPLELPRIAIDRRMANTLLREIGRRDDSGLCSYTQAALLARLGCPIGWIPSLSRAEASAMVRLLAQDYWMRPREWAGLRESARRAAGL